MKFFTRSNLIFFVIFIAKVWTKETSNCYEKNSRSMKNSNRSFVIDYENDVYLKDGKEFHYVSGSFHYFRAPRVYWRDRLRKMRLAGLNCVDTYIEWSTHEPQPGTYEFEGDKDIEHFFEVAAEEGLLVILRPGPFISAERDFDGFPSWLITLHENIVLRTNNPDYLLEVRKWFAVLFKKLEKHFYGNGGPIILVQVENEYGSIAACSMEYRIWLRDEMRKYVRDAAVLFTTDGAATHYLECGHIPGVYATVDFGPTSDTQELFKIMRQYSPRGPLVNSEFYPGWLTHWGTPESIVETNIVLDTMNQMLDQKANFNFYMFFGGTNFAFKNGAGGGFSTEVYAPIITSYDYDAPMNEAGDPTPKYRAIRDLLNKRGYSKPQKGPVIPPSPKGNYGKFQLRAALSIFDTFSIKDKIVSYSLEPKTFEELNLSYGYVLYETRIPENITDPAILYVPVIRDRIIVYLDHLPSGILTRINPIYMISLQAKSGQKLSLLIENQGRNCFPGLNQGLDVKGLTQAPELDGIPLLNWTMTGLPFEHISWIYELPVPEPTCKIKPPALYTGHFFLPSHAEPLDTYLDTTGWGKGVVFINDCHLGRYWPGTGPQVTLFVPGSCLRASPKKNLVAVFETEYTSQSQEMKFIDFPILNSLGQTEIFQDQV